MTTVLDQPNASGVDDVEPCENETRDRIITGTVTIVRRSSAC